MPKFPIGVDNFRKLIQEGNLFVDHTLMIREFIEEGDDISLILRPRRWGKSLTLSMLYYFLAMNEQGAENIFEGLNIATFDNGIFLKKYRKQNPVILISLKSIKESTFKGFLMSISDSIVDLYSSHQYLLDSEKLTLADKKMFNVYLNGTTNNAKLIRSIKRLSELLTKHFDSPTYIFIDEYDTPMNFASRDSAELEEITKFMKAMLGEALKGNDFLKKGLMTGILRLSKNSMLSDLNNLKIYSSLDKKYSEYYGFLEEDVNKLFSQCGITHQAKEIKHWYNGYYSGTRVVYNPWSIMNCLSEDGIIKPYWVLTSSDDLIKQAFVHADLDVKEKFSQLLLGGKIQGIIESFTKFEEINTSSKALWTLLFYAGYLKATNVSNVGLNYSCQLEIPNEEVKYVYQAIFQEWLEQKIGDSNYQSLLNTLNKGEVEVFIQHLNEYLVQSTSFRDFTKESDYHCFVLGLISGMMHTHQLESNKEQGFGFSDLTLIPLDKKNSLGLIFEFKHVKSKTDKNQSLKIACEEALKQIEEKDYKRILMREQYQYVHIVLEIGMAFLGKSVAASYRKIDLKSQEILSKGYVEN
jgi:hypothetical protein